MEDTVGNYYCGEWKLGEGSAFTVNNKYSGKIMARLKEVSSSETDMMLSCAQQAFNDMKLWPKEEKRSRIKTLIDKLEPCKSELVDLIVAEAGKPIDYAIVELDRCISTLRETLKAFDEMEPKNLVLGNDENTKNARLERFPRGICLAISPFNFPLNLAIHKIAPALIVGNPVIIKPSPRTPLSMIRFVEILSELDYPKGAVNLIHGSNELTAELVKDSHIKIMSFTGSDRVGWYLKSIAGKKKVCLELGGNAAVIVESSDDIANVARNVAYGACLYAGQICISTQQILVKDELYNDFREALKFAIHEIKCGNCDEYGVVNGPMISSDEVSRIDEWVREACAMGATLLTGGVVLDSVHNIYAPTILEHVNEEMKVVSEEAFAPIAVLRKFSSMDDAIQMVNASRYGLQTGLYSTNEEVIEKAYLQLDVGALIINNVPGYRHDAMPYGGVKDSGEGREGPRYALEDMTEPKLIVY